MELIKTGLDVLGNEAELVTNGIKLTTKGLGLLGNGTPPK